MISPIAMCGMDHWQPHHLAVVQARRFSLFGHTACMADETCQEDLNHLCRTGGDHHDALVPRGWRLYSRTWNQINSPWMRQLMRLRIVHSGDWCLCLALLTPSGACQK